MAKTGSGLSSYEVAKVMRACGCFQRTASTEDYFVGGAGKHALSYIRAAEM